jgi:hypothetical protein
MFSPAWTPSGKPVYFTESTTDEAQVDTILTKLLRRADEQRSPGSADNARVRHQRVDPRQ